jgi:hypothetical protein
VAKNIRRALALIFFSATVLYLILLIVMFGALTSYVHLGVAAAAGWVLFAVGSQSVGALIRYAAALAGASALVVLFQLISQFGYGSAIQPPEKMLVTTAVVFVPLFATLSLAFVLWVPRPSRDDAALRAAPK